MTRRGFLALLVLLVHRAAGVMDDAATADADSGALSLQLEGGINGTEGEIPIGRTLFLLQLLKQKLSKLHGLVVLPTTPGSIPRCFCVPYYLCDANSGVITDGSGVVDFRYRQCTGDIEVCCFLRVTNPTIPTTQTPMVTSPPATQSTLPTTMPTVSTLPTTPSPPPTQPTTQPPTQATIVLPLCTCIPIYQCAQNAQTPATSTTVQPIDPRQQYVNTCVGAFVCCSYVTGVIPQVPTSTFPPFTLPVPMTTIPTTTTTTTTTLAPIIIGQSCICTLLSACSLGYITTISMGNIDPRLVLGRQGQPPGSCSGVNSMCCRIVDSNVGLIPQANHGVQSNKAPLIDVKNAGMSNACSCVPMEQCPEGEAVTYENVEGIDPRFGPCKSATLVCCKLHATRQRSDLQPFIQVPEPNYSACGIQDTTFANYQQPYGSAYFGEFPWMAILLVRKAGQSDVFQCGGSLINSRTILTAAHCVVSCDPGTLYARLGEHDTQNANEYLPFQEIISQSIIIHPTFYSGALYHDVALVILAKPVTYAANVRRVCLPTQGQAFAAGTICYASGWGRNAFGAGGMYQSVLRKVDLPIIDNPTCQTQLRSTRLGAQFLLHASFICAGGEANKDTCYKDGGGPLVCKDSNGRFIQAGIVSWGIGCGSRAPAVYASVAQHADWINQQVASLGITY